MLANAFTHAFVDADVPVLRVRARSADGSVRIQVVDNGVGMPDDLPGARPATLGVRPIRALVEQLDGTLETTRQPRRTRTDLMLPLGAGDAADDKPVPHVQVSVPA